MAILKVGGKTVEEATRRTDVELLAAWDQAVTVMLEAAAKSGPHREKCERMREWLAEHRDHPLYGERYEKYWFERMKANEVSGQLMDLATDVWRIQRQMSPRMLELLTDRLGAPLYPHVSQQFAIYARKTGSTDLLKVVEAWQMDENREDYVNPEPCPF